MNNFRSYQIAVEFYTECRLLALPRHFRDQLDRAASSVALNLAEGSGRSTRRDQKRFFDIAFASLRESQAILDLNIDKGHKAHQLADKLAANIFCLIRSIKMSS